MVSVDVGSASLASSPFKPHWNLYPRTYVAPRITYPLFENLDGDLSKAIWEDIPWSEVFDDIRGVEDAPPDERPNQHCHTRFKAVWDEDYLYIGALIETDFETIAEFEDRNSPIFQKDSDFEVFIDPIGSCHWYKELELNAINTVWNLMLDKPYMDGGSEHSGRIAKPTEKNYYEVYHQKTAVRVLEGRLNTPGGGTIWSLEIAVSYKDILSHIVDAPGPIKLGTTWRLNFSRVENKGDINWTWQPQIVWNPKDRRFSGHVNMHLPDAWGYISFGPPIGDKLVDNVPPKDSTWPARLAAMHIYYAQVAFKDDGGVYASDVEQLSNLIDPVITAPFNIVISLNDNGGYTVVVSGNPDGSIVSVTHERFISVSPGVISKDS